MVYLVSLGLNQPPAFTQVYLELYCTYVQVFIVKYWGYLVLSFLIIYSNIFYFWTLLLTKNTAIKYRKKENEEA